jgi:hypothetical protein
LNGLGSAIVKLTQPSGFFGVEQDKVSLRAPTVGDLRAAKKPAGNGDEFQEIVLLASLSACAPNEIERLPVRDYHHVQEAYFRLVSEDTDGTGDSHPGEAAGE